MTINQVKFSGNKKKIFANFSNKPKRLYGSGVILANSAFFVKAVLNSLILSSFGMGSIPVKNSYKRKPRHLQNANKQV